MKTVSLNNVEYSLEKSTVTAGVFEGFEIITEQTDYITWDGHRQGTVSISWTSDRDGYAILTKGCSIFAGYFTEVSYSITVNETAIDNNSGYRIDVGNDVNNRVFLFPIKVGDKIAATITGNSGSSSGTLTLRLRASIVTPVDGGGEDGGILSKINLNGVIYNLDGSSDTLPTLTGVAGNVQETQANQASDVQLSWTADEDCNIMVLMMHSYTASFTAYEASCNLGMMGDLFMNSDASISSRASVFFLKSGDTVNTRYRIYADGRNFSYIRIYKIK